MKEFVSIGAGFLSNNVCIQNEKGFDRVYREDVWKIIQKRGTESRTTEMLRALYKNNSSVVRINNVELREFEVEVGLRQGCVLSPLLLFSVVLDEGIKKSKKYNEEA